ncbi:hypothetical protein MGQ_01411, partial [Candida albicans P76067]
MLGMRVEVEGYGTCLPRGGAL